MESICSFINTRVLVTLTYYITAGVKIVNVGVKSSQMINAHICAMRSVSLLLYRTTKIYVSYSAHLQSTHSVKLGPMKAFLFGSIA